jgi:hypothetical protein
MFEGLLTHFRDVLGDVGAMEDIFLYLGDLACDEVDPASAAVNYRNALPAWDTVKDPWAAAHVLFGFAGLAQTIGHHEQAGRLFGAAGALYDEVDLVLPPHDRFNYPRILAATRAALGEEAFAAAYGAGWMLSFEQARAEALALADEVAPSSGGSLSSAPSA